jgi:hypothetical protein
MEACDCVSEPLLDRCLHFGLMSLPFQAVDGFALLIQRDEVTRYILVEERSRDEIYEKTLATGVRPLWKIEIEAGR